MIFKYMALPPLPQKERDDDMADTPYKMITSNQFIALFPDARRHESVLDACFIRFRLSEDMEFVDIKLIPKAAYTHSLGLKDLNFMGKLRFSICEEGFFLRVSTRLCQNLGILLY